MEKRQSLVLKMNQSLIKVTAQSNIGFWYWSYYVGLQRDVSGSPLGGYGYTVSPRLQQDYNGTWLTYSDQTRDFFQAAIG